MKLIAPLAGLALLAGCASQGPYVNQHWSERSIGPRMSRAFLSYDPENDGSYRDFQWKKKQSINLTISRHLFNHNPENPFQAESPDFYKPRPNHSLLPRAYNYIHMEGIALGAIAYAGGAPAIIPLPLDSIIGTFEEGGTEEFVQGVGEFVRPLGVLTASFLHDGLGFPESKGTAWRGD
ncbi:MAG: hypothetical protein U1F29_05120 [Planctomycetota bacterium]